jgi:GNAT superfamily N-acetyltransferase
MNRAAEMQALIRISRPLAADTDAILDIHQRAFVQGCTNETNGKGASLKALNALVNGSFAERNRVMWGSIIGEQDGIWVARLGKGAITGFGRIVDLEESAYLDALYVDPVLHNRGIGSALLTRLLAESGQERTELVTTAWSPAVHFYQSHGFAITDEVVPPPTPPQAYGITLNQVAMIRE